VLGEAIVYTHATAACPSSILAHATAAFASSLSILLHMPRRLLHSPCPLVIEYLAEQDGVQAFLAENCEFEEDFRESSVALFHMYLEESGDSNDREKWFHRQMKNKGFVKKVLQIKGKSTRGYMGLRLRHDE